MGLRDTAQARDLTAKLTAADNMSWQPPAETPAPTEGAPANGSPATGTGPAPKKG
jgi:hypothetical protein